MSVASSSSSSSSSTSTRAKHDVFLSFRGEDTRARFTSHLLAKLSQKNVETFIDNRLSKGDEISPTLIEAIRRSRISIIIFSENYAFSSWCLDEVVCILKCKKERGQIVIPVFYDIDPSHVRKQLQCYALAFAKHEEHYNDKINKVKYWRAALTEVANISGWDSRKYKGTEHEFVEAIAKDIQVKLKDMYSTRDEFQDLVGIDKSIGEMEQLLCIDDSTTVLIVGIWGMGGQGKTTLARVIFKRLSSKFQGSCFHANIREESGKPHGLESLKKKLFSELLGENGVTTVTSFYKEKLRRKKVLIVLDDVDNPEQLEVLAAEHGWFGPGSRIIVTTRDAQVLRNIGADKIYELKGLAFDDALQLFDLNAFKVNFPTAEDVLLSESVLKYAKGSPLALKVLGSFLRSRKRENWEMELNKLKEVPNQRIHNILKVSFDGLDKIEKAIFLDIVCFFSVGHVTCKTYVERRLGTHRSYVDIGIGSLIDKSLVTVEDNNLVVHDMLREMGWQIVRQQCIEEPGKRSRLWSVDDVYHVLKNNTGTATIEGISSFISKGDLSPTVFKEMHRLWILDIFPSDFHFPQGLEYLPNSLKCLIWRVWPWKSLPSNFMPHNLVELRMPHSKLEQLWSGGVQDLGNLKYVDLRHSYRLTEVSVLSQAPNLVRIDLSHCIRLRQVPSLRFGTRNKLASLDQSYHKCDQVECQTLGHLKLDGCKNLKVVEKISGNVKELHVRSTSVSELPSSVCSLINLEYLNLRECRILKSLPSDILKMKSLKRLDLGGCSSFDELPVLRRNLSELPSEIGCLSSLEKLCLEGSSIVRLPVTIKNLSKLIELLIRQCKRLKSLPELPSSLEILDASGCNALEAISNSRDALIQGFRSGNHVMTCRKISYAYCLKLDQSTRNNIVSEFQLRTLDTSIKSLLPHGVLKKSDYPSVAISCPGNKIPMWFMYQSESSSINIKLSSVQQNPSFLGFALCAVVVEDISCLELSCEANFKTKYGKSYKFHWNFNNFSVCSRPLGILSNSSNVFMWYKHENYHGSLDRVVVSFRFYDKLGRGNIVRACGVRPLYYQDAEELGITRKLGKTNVIKLYSSSQIYPRRTTP